MLPDYRAAPRAASPLGAGRAARLRGRPAPPPRAAAHGDPERRLPHAVLPRLRALVAWCVAHRAIVIAVTLAVFAVSLALFRFVPQQFFPASSRPELLVDLRLPEGSVVRGDARARRRGSRRSSTSEPGVESYVAYVGSGSPRFYLPLDQQLQQSNFAQFVVLREEQRRARAPAHAAARAVRRRFPGAARPRLAARERPAGRLSGAVPRLGRGHPEGARDRAARWRP